MRIYLNIRKLYEAIMGQELKRELDRHRRAADALDAAVREMLER
jgi:hypothetical protein